MTVQIQPTNGKKSKTEELIKELLVLRSLFIKFGVEDYENDALFVEMANEVGVTGTYGKPLTYMAYRQMMKRADQKMIKEFIHEMELEHYTVIASRDHCY